MQEVVVAVYSLVMGYLLGALVYVISGAFWTQDHALGEPGRPRAVVRVPESRCRSVRCALTRSEQTEHLVEVRLLERGATLVKVDWPRGFEHLEAWTYVTDIVEELPNPTQRLSAELERWLSTLGDAEGTRPLPTAGEPDAPDSADATESVAAGTPAE